MKSQLGPRTQRLLQGLLHIEQGRALLGEAIWLYVHFLTVTNDRGLIVRHVGKLSDDLDAPRELVESWLGTLSKAGLIMIHTPLPYLVAKLQFWPDEPPEVAIPYSKLLQSRMDKSNSNRSAAVENSGDLLQEILDTLGETDPAPFQKIFDHYPNGIIRQALDRVRTANKIHKNPTALFRYLLVKLASKSHAKH